MSQIVVTSCKNVPLVDLSFVNQCFLVDKHFFLRTKCWNKKLIS